MSYLRDRGEMNRNIVIENEDLENRENWFLKTWVSKQYRTIGYLCRNYTIDEQYRKFPELFYWMQKMSEAMIHRGITPHRLSKEEGIPYLYRGVNVPSRGSNSFQHTSWIATTKEKRVATEFSQKGEGTSRIFILPLSSLPNIPLLPITRDIVPYSFEKEVLLPPGLLIPTGQTINECEVIQYQPNLGILKKYLSKPIQRRMKGGHLLDHPKQLEGKHIYFYRQIKGQPIEVIGCREKTDHIEDVGEWFFYNIKLPLSSFDNSMTMIPNIMEMRLQIAEESSPKNSPIYETLASYYPEVALYDPTNETILSFPEGKNLQHTLLPAIHTFQKYISLHHTLL